MNDEWKKYMTPEEQAKMNNLEYEMRMIMNRCIARHLREEKKDA